MSDQQTSKNIIRNPNVAWPAPIAPPRPVNSPFADRPAAVNGTPVKKGSE